MRKHVERTPSTPLIGRANKVWRPLTLGLLWLESLSAHAQTTTAMADDTQMDPTVKVMVLLGLCVIIALRISNDE